MPIDQVGELLVRWRGAGGVFGRGRVLRESIQLLAGLDGDERRLLARSLAEQGVPDLAARVETRSGGAMSADQLWSVADGLLAMDDHQVDRLAASLRDPAERERLARQAVAHGVASFYPATDPTTDPTTDPAPSHRHRLDELPPPGAIVDRAGVEDRLPPHSFDEEPNPQQGASPGIGSSELGSPELGSPELGWQDLQTSDLLEPGLVDVGLAEVGLADVELAEVGSEMEDAPSSGRAGGGAATAATAAIVHEPRSGDDHADAPDDDTEGAAEPSASTDEGEQAPDTPAVPDTPGRQQAAADVTTLLQALTDAPTATSRLRLLGTHELDGLDGPSALAVLDVLPDGWQRRRAAGRLVDAGAFPTGDLDAALGRFARPADAVFVAGALHAAGQVQAERFSGMLPEGAVRRLIARSER